MSYVYQFNKYVYIESHHHVAAWYTFKWQWLYNTKIEMLVSKCCFYYENVKSKGYNSPSSLTIPWY